MENSLKRYEDVVAACNRCGFCTSYCPTYNATGNEAQSPRGRNQMFRALIEGKITDTAHALDSIDTCLLCGECTSVCFSEVPTADLMVQARNFINNIQGVPRFLRFFLDSVLPNPQRLYWVLKISFWCKRMGLAWISEKLGLLQRFSPTLAAAERLVDKVPPKFLLERKETFSYQEQILKEKKQGQAITRNKMVPASKTILNASPVTKIAFVPVCGSQYIRPNIGLSAIRLFKRLKLDFIIPQMLCCGLPAASYGVLEQVKFMAKENISRLERGKFENIVADDSSCLAHIKEYSKYLQEDQGWLQRAHGIAQRLRDMATFLLQRGLQEHLKLAPWEGGAVAFHDPCKAQYGLRSTQSPRELLNAIPRLSLVQIPDADQCCGGGGTYSFVHPDISESVLTSKMNNILESGCDIVVTSSASCLIQLSYGLRQRKSKIEALHLTEFLMRVLDRVTEKRK